MGVYVFGALFFLLHVVVPANDFLLPVKLFYILIMFSISIIILHFMAKRIAKGTGTSMAANPRLDGSATAERLVQACFFLIGRIFPVMIFIFQILVICSLGMQDNMLHPSRGKIIQHP